MTCTVTTFQMFADSRFASKRVRGLLTSTPKTPRSRRLFTVRAGGWRSSRGGAWHDRAQAACDVWCGVAHDGGRARAVVELVFGDARETCQGCLCGIAPDQNNITSTAVFFLLER